MAQTATQSEQNSPTYDTSKLRNTKNNFLKKTQKTLKLRILFFIFKIFTGK